MRVGHWVDFVGEHCPVIILEQGDYLSGKRLCALARRLGAYRRINGGNYIFLRKGEEEPAYLPVRIVSNELESRRRRALVRILSRAGRHASRSPSL